MAAAVPTNRTITLGYAAETGPWVSNWSLAGVAAVQKTDVSNAAEAWSAIKYTDVLPTTLAGGDIYRGDLGVSGQSSATSTVKQEIDGKEALRFNLAEAAQAVSIDLASFYANDDGTAYAEGARVRLFNGSTLVGETFVTAQSALGKQLVQINSAQIFTSVDISAGALKADGSFSYGGYSNSNGSFGSDSYTNGSKHGSDFLLNGISFEVARPNANGDNYTLQEDAASQTGNVLNNDSNPDSGSLTAVLNSGPSHGTLTLNADGSFSYRPDADYNGADSFSYRASNGKDLSDVATVTLTINAVNDGPAAVNDSASTDEDTIVTGNVLANDSDRDGDTLHVSSTGTYTTQRGATITINADGSFSYSARNSVELQALDNSASRVDSFTYNVSDGHGGVASARLDITVQGRDEAGASVMQANVDPGTELVYYMRYTDAGGTSKWMEIDGLGLGTESATSIGKGGAAAVGKTTLDAVTLEIGSGKAVTDFTARMLNGTRVDSIEIEAYTKGEHALPAQLVQEYRFTGNVVTSLQTSANEYGGTSNSLSFNYRTFDQALTPLGANGKPLAAQKTSWDAGKASATLPDGAAIDPGADANLQQLANLTSSDTSLTYYIHIDGVTGWVELSNFALGYSAASSYVGATPSIGKATPSQVTLDLGLNQVLTTLFKNEIIGQSLATIQIEAYSTQAGNDGRPLLVDEYIFNKTYTGLVDAGINASNTVSLGYTSFSHAHVAYRADGRVDTANSSNVGYDFQTGKTATAPATNAEAIGAGSLPDVSQGTELTYYMRYTDASGASKWMEIDSVSFGVEAALSTIKGSGAGAGKASSNGVTLEMGSSKAVSAFTSSLLGGKAVSSIEIEAYASGERGPASKLVQEFKFTDAFATSAQTSAGHDGATSNALSFSYRTLDQAIITYSADGKPLPAQKASWDVSKNSATLPAGAELQAGANANQQQLEAVDDTGAPLDYYLRVDGVNGWVALSNFSMGYEADSNYLKGSPSVGKAVPSKVSMELGLSQALATLYGNQIQGKQAAIQIEAYAHGSVPGKAQLVDEYIFSQTLTTDVQIGSDAHNAVSFVYNAFSHSHLAYDDRGKVDAANSSSNSYDFATGKTASVPAAVADMPSEHLAPSVLENTGLTYYLRYTESGHTSDWIAVRAISVGATAESSFLKGSGAAVSKATPGDFTLEMGGGEAINDFIASILTGKVISNLEIEAYARGGAGPGLGQLAQEYKLTNAFVTSAQTAAGEDGATTNQLSFTYRTLDQGLYTQGQDGKLVATQKVSWDVSKNTATLPDGAALDPGADARLPQNTLDGIGRPLEYYIHVDGVSGWVALSEFNFGYTADSSYLKGTGAAVGKPVASEVTLGLGLNQVLSTLLKDEFAGKANNIQIEAYVHGGADQMVLVDEYFFNGAYTSGLAIGSDASNELTLVYSTFTHTHLTYDERGRADASSIGYDLNIAKIIGVPTAVAEVYS